jgi:hypothetical protein
MDRASEVLAQGVPHGVPKSYRALADYHGDVGHTTLYHRDNGRQSIEEKALGQHYLSPCETKALVQFLLQMSNLGQPVRIKYIPSIAFLATRNRSIRRDRFFSLKGDIYVFSDGTASCRASRYQQCGLLKCMSVWIYSTNHAISPSRCCGYGGLRKAAVAA